MSDPERSFSEEEQDGTFIDADPDSGPASEIDSAALGNETGPASEEDLSDQGAAGRGDSAGAAQRNLPLMPPD